MLHKSVISLFSLLPYRFVEFMPANIGESHSFMLDFHDDIKHEINEFKRKYDKSMNHIRKFVHYTNHVVIPYYLKCGTLKNLTTYDPLAEKESLDMENMNDENKENNNDYNINENDEYSYSTHKPKNTTFTIRNKGRVTRVAVKRDNSNKASTTGSTSGKNRKSASRSLPQRLHFYVASKVIYDSLFKSFDEILLFCATSLNIGNSGILFEDSRENLRDKRRYARDGYRSFRNDDNGDRSGGGGNRNIDDRFSILHFIRNNYLRIYHRFKFPNPKLIIKLKANDLLLMNVFSRKYQENPFNNIPNIPTIPSNIENITTTRTTTTNTINNNNNNNINQSAFRTTSPPVAAITTISNSLQPIAKHDNTFDFGYDRDNNVISSIFSGLFRNSGNNSKNNNQDGNENGRQSKIEYTYDINYRSNVEAIVSLLFETFPRFDDSYNGILTRLMKFSMLECETAFENVKVSYLYRLMKMYSQWKHYTKMKRAMPSYGKEAVGPCKEFYGKLLLKHLHKIWVNGREKCDALSLTGHTCERPVHQGRQVNK